MRSSEFVEQRNDMDSNYLGKGTAMGLRVKQGTDVGLKGEKRKYTVLHWNTTSTGFEDAWETSLRLQA
jgi:hypothetical protein